MERSKKTRRQRTRRKPLPQDVEYYDERSELRSGRATERNGNLMWVEDSTTGQGQYLAPFEIRE
jgi:hypothetical protein